MEASHTLDPFFKRNAPTATATVPRIEADMIFTTLLLNDVPPLIGTGNFGRAAVNIAANRLLAAGATPRYLSGTLTVDTDTPVDVINAIADAMMSGAVQAEAEWKNMECRFVSSGPRYGVAASIFGVGQLPPDFADGSFDFAVSFQVIEHIERDAEFVREVSRVLRDGGRFIVSTPNAPMSLTRNPWHVREYTAEELRELLLRHFSEVECLGVAGNERVMEYYAANKASVERVARFDVFDLQHRLPRRLLRIPYDILNRINRRRLLADNRDLTQSITMDDYRIGPVTEESFDLYFIARKGR